MNKMSVKIASYNITINENVLVLKGKDRIAFTEKSTFSKRCFITNTNPAR